MTTEQMLREIMRLARENAAEAKRKARKAKANKGREAVKRALTKKGTFSQAELDALSELPDGDIKNFLKKRRHEQLCGS